MIFTFAMLPELFDIRISLTKIKSTAKGKSDKGIVTAGLDVSPNFIFNAWSERIFTFSASLITVKAPATLLFLRNQARDSVRILLSGYPLWLGLALPAYFRLRAWTSGPVAARVVLSWTAAFTLILILKDPLFLPSVFLQIKEDLFFAPLACILGGMTLYRLGRWGKLGKLLVGGILLAVGIWFLTKWQRRKRQLDLTNTMKTELQENAFFVEQSPNHSSL